MSSRNLNAKIDSYPLCHRDRFFCIITHLDLQFEEVRKILDYILDNFEHEEILEKEGLSLEIFTENYLYSVELYGYEVVVLSQKPLSG